MNEERLLGYKRRSDEEIQERAKRGYQEMSTRRSVRDFSSEKIPEGVLESCLLAAGTAPSGANMQPWHFAVVRGVAVKRKIREAAEIEEREFYSGKAPDEWLDVLLPLGTDARKPFLETAPVLIAVFQKSKCLNHRGVISKVYYAKESVGIATGFLIASLHQAGLATLTHTPSPMKFLNKILGRPAEEKPFLLLVVGHPAEGCKVPAIEKKGLEGIVSFQ